MTSQNWQTVLAQALDLCVSFHRRHRWRLFAARSCALALGGTAVALAGGSAISCFIKPLTTDVLFIISAAGALGVFLAGRPWRRLPDLDASARLLDFQTAGLDAAATLLQIQKKPVANDAENPAAAFAGWLEPRLDTWRAARPAMAWANFRRAGVIITIFSALTLINFALSATSADMDNETGNAVHPASRSHSVRVVSQMPSSSVRQKTMDLQTASQKTGISAEELARQLALAELAASAKESKTNAMRTGENNSQTGSQNSSARRNGTDNSASVAARFSEILPPLTPAAVRSRWETTDIPAPYRPALDKYWQEVRK